MPLAPWFVTGPSALLAALGHWRGPDPTVPSPAEDWRRAVVDVVIPARRNQQTIVHCLASLLDQTRLPRRVLLVDDGGIERDHSIQFAREFARANGVQLQIVSRAWSIGRAATLKRQAREFQGDVMFVLDADTVLESPDYIERCVRELYQGVGIASACGTVLPLRSVDRFRLAAMPAFRRWLAGDAYRDPLPRPDVWQRLAAGLGDAYRTHLAAVQQGYVDGGLMRRHGSIAATCGGAVAYRRRYLKDLFNRYEPIRGDDLTPAEDHFIALALASAGYRNIRVADVVARAQYPALQHLPADAWQWTIAVLQGGHYFDTLLRSPLRAAGDRWRQWRQARQVGHGGLALARERLPRPDGRKIREAYRQPFGERMTRQHGRPIGAALLCIALERVGYPVLLLVLALGGHWAALAALVGVEVMATLAIAWRHAPQPAPDALLQGVLATPLRYALILLEPFAMTWFGIRLWLRGDFRWYVRRELDGVRGRRARATRP